MESVLLNWIIFQIQFFFKGSNPVTEENVCFKTGKCYKSMQITVKKVTQKFLNIYNCSAQS